jgi:hypothetical protein
MRVQPPWRQHYYLALRSRPRKPPVLARRRALLPTPWLLRCRELVAGPRVRAAAADKAEVVRAIAAVEEEALPVPAWVAAEGRAAAGR